MLRELRIRNLAVIEAITVGFAPGLNVLTGETGAGKSIVIDALLLLLGGRAQADVIRTDAESALVEGVFEVPRGAPAAEVLAGVGIEVPDGQIVIRRELSRTGRHRAFVNDSAVTVGLLERLGDQLVEVHGQHEHQRLLEPLRQLELLDRFAGAHAMASRVSDLFHKHHAASGDLEKTRAVERDRAQREDTLRFQVGEIDAASLRPGEEEELRVRRRRLQQSERLLAGLAEAAALLDEDRESVRARMSRASRVLQDLGRIDPSLLATVEGLETAAIQVQEVLGTIRAAHHGLDVEPGALEAIDERLDALSRLKRKYGDSEEAMLAFRHEAATELDRLARYEEVLADQARLQAELHVELVAAARVLSDRRRTAAGDLAAQTQRELRVLGMERAEFGIALDGGQPDALTARGWDRIEFRLAANPGEDAQPLARVASGGELSRTMLALSAALVTAEEVPTAVFDEVDAGVGGRIAGVVGDRLAAVASRRQVLAVTHLAQIAARADHHVRVTKAVRGGRTRASVVVLDADARVAELASMVGGDARTAQVHAREMLAAGRRRPNRAR